MRKLDRKEKNSEKRRDWEGATGSGHGNILGRYRHILVLEGCYDIRKDDQKGDEMEEGSELNDTPTQHGGWMNRQTWPHNKRNFDRIFFSVSTIKLMDYFCQL